MTYVGLRWGRAVLNHHATSGLDVPGANLSRAVVILPVLKVNITSLNEFVQNKGLLEGLLLLLPQRSNESAGGEGRSAVVERVVFNPTLDPGDIDICTWIFSNEFLSCGGMSCSYKLVVSAFDAKKIATPTMTNIQGWLPGLRAEGDNSMLPTIAIVASYDTFGAASALAVGSDSNGSGVAMLLELARLFSRLYANLNT